MLAARRALLVALLATAASAASAAAPPLRAASSAGLAPPSQLRTNLHTHARGGAAVFVSLDAVAGGPAGGAVRVSWVAADASATDARVVVTSPTAPGGAQGGANVTVFDSGWFPTTFNATAYALLNASVLEGARAYDWVALSRDALGRSSASAPARFFTSAPPGHWLPPVSAPLWPTRNCTAVGALAPPSFARFRAAAPMPSGGAASVVTALLFVTGAPPIFSDPWNVTKLAGGYKLRVAGAAVGMGPGKAACGPANKQSRCAASQPVDGYDVTLAAAAAAAAGAPLELDLSSYGVVQAEYGVAPAVQAVLHVRAAGGRPDVVFGTNPGPGGGWLALDADPVTQPGANKAPFWYTQPQENVVTACLPALPPAAARAGAAPPPPPPPPPCAAVCGWAPAPPAPAGAFAGRSLRLTGKPTLALAYEDGVAPGGAVPVARLSAGRYVMDAGGEMQGGAQLRLAPGAAPAGVRVLVRLGEELLSNGSAMFHLRAGNVYEDAWTFPPTLAARPEQLFVEHHEFCEFRWAELLFTNVTSGAEVAVEPGAFRFSFWRVRYPYDDAAAARVRTSDAALDAVYAFAANTLKATTLDMYADSNTRQRSLDCMADDATAAAAHYATTAELAFPRFAAAQIWATMDGGYVSPNWADWTILPALNLVLDALYTGDLSFAAAAFDDVLANHTYRELVNASTGLVTSADLSALVDTSGGSDDGFVQSSVNAVVNAWTFLGFEAFGRLAAWLRRPDDARALAGAAQRLRAGFRARLFNGSAVCDGECANTPHASAHASFYALYAGLLNATETAAVAATLRARVAAEGALGVPCGAYPVQFLLHALYRDGADHGNAAWGVLTATTRHSWRNMMDAYGATTTMECWLPEELPNLSFSHVWSASPAILIPTRFFGVEPTAPGYSSVDVRPQPGPVAEGEAVLPTVRGPLSVAFAQTAPGKPGGCFTLALRLPPGVTGTAFLPRWGASVNVTVDGEPAASAEDGDYAAVTVQGDHVLSTC